MPKAPLPGGGGRALRKEDGQAADVELLPEPDDVEEDAAAGAAVDVEDEDDEVEAGFEAGVLLEEEPRLSFR